MEVQRETERLSIEIKKTQSELEAMKAKLNKMNDEGSILDDLEKKYQLLTQEFKSRSDTLRKCKMDNQSLETAYSSLASTMDPEKASLANTLNSLQMQLEEEIGTNATYENTLKNTGTRLEDAKDIESKGTRAQTEVEKVKKWRERKAEEEKRQEENLKEVQGQRKARDEDVKNKEQEAQNAKNAILAENQKATEVLNTILSRDRYRQNLEKMLRAHRSTELVLQEKVDYLTDRVKVEGDRNNALALIRRQNMKKSNIAHHTIEDKLADLQRVYAIKEKFLENDNTRLKKQLEGLRTELDALDMHHLDESYTNWSLSISHESKDDPYGAINSLIESISQSGDTFSKVKKR